MSLMANPMEALNDYQRALNTGMEINPNEIDGDYLKRIGEIVRGVTRFDFVKIVDQEVQAIAMFVQEEPFNNTKRYSVAYAVSEKYRGRSLAIETATKGLEELKKTLRRDNIQKFYVEALIDKTNIHSIKVAEKLFSSLGTPKEDDETGTPALLFYSLIAVQ